MVKKCIGNFNNNTNKFIISDPLYESYGDNVSEQGYISNVYIGSWNVYVKETSNSTDLILETYDCNQQWNIFEECAIQESSGIIGVFDESHYKDNKMAQSISTDVYLDSGIEVFDSHINKLYNDEKYGQWYAVCFGSILKNKGYSVIPYGCVIAVHDLTINNDNNNKTGPYECYITKNPDNQINGIKIKIFNSEKNNSDNESDNESDDESDESEYSSSDSNSNHSSSSSDYDSDDSETSNYTDVSNTSYSSIVRRELGDGYVYGSGYEVINITFTDLKDSVQNTIAISFGYSSKEELIKYHKDIDIPWDGFPIMTLKLFKK